MRGWKTVALLTTAAALGVGVGAATAHDRPAEVADAARSGLPEGFPTDLALPAGSLRDSFRQDLDRRTLYRLTYDVVDGPANLTALADRLETSGWDVKRNQGTGKAPSTVAANRNGRELTLLSQPNATTATASTITMIVIEP